MILRHSTALTWSRIIVLAEDVLAKGWEGRRAGRLTRSEIFRVAALNPCIVNLLGLQLEPLLLHS